MVERYVRLVLICIMLVILLLPWRPFDPVGSTFINTLWFLMEGFLPHLFSATPLGRTDLVINFFYFFKIPILILLNGCLLIFASNVVKGGYRILLPLLFILTWQRSLEIDPDYRGIGYWAEIGMISIAFLIELIFLLNEYLKRQQKTVHVVE